MSTWSIVVPEAGHNLVTNPSLENDTTGYSPAEGGGTIARDMTDQRRGVACLKVVPAVNGSDGCYYAITLTAAITYAYSFDFKGKAGVPYRACLYDLVTLSVLGQQITFTGDDRWHRYEGVATNGTNTNVCVLVSKNGSTSTDPFYLDGMQVEQADHPTTYIDGDQDGCKWLGPAHAAQSERSAQYRLGGRVRDIDSLASGITVQSFSGAGMPPVVNLTQNRALLPGKIYCGTKVAERVIQLLILANGTSLENWHYLRKTLIDVVKPDAVNPQQPFLLRYSGAGPTVEIPVVYGGGLEQGEKSGFAEAIVLRLIAYDDPYWAEEGEKAQTVSVSQNLNVSYIVGKIAGAWNALGNNGTNVVRALALSQDGNTLYVGGGFTNWAGIAYADGIVRYDLVTGTWSALGTGVSGMLATIFALAVAPDETLYAAGSFTTASGVSCNNVARWNGSAWSALGTGLDNPAVAAVVAPDGSLYVGGLFLNAGGGSANRIAKWNGGTWSALGTGVGNGPVEGLAVGPDGAIYAGGGFTTAGGITANYIAKWNGSAWSALGSGTNGGVMSIAVAPDGTVYATGGFSLAGGLSANSIAKWNGSSWSALGSGLDSTGYTVVVASDGTLYVGGVFTTAGGVALADRLAKWNGSAWLPLDIDLPGTSYVYVIVNKGNDLYLGFTTSGAATLSYALTPTASNFGSASVAPIITLKRTGGTSATLQLIKNETTGKTINFNYALADGETLTIDLRAGKKAVRSSAFGNMLSKVLGGSDFATWELLPGTNQLSLYVVLTGSPTISAAMRWRFRHWSADGGAA